VFSESLPFAEMGLDERLMFCLVGPLIGSFAVCWLLEIMNGVQDCCNIVWRGGRVCFDG
jgi:hypothetical protein